MDNKSSFNTSESGADTTDVNDRKTSDTIDIADILEGTGIVLESRDFSSIAESLFSSCKRLTGATAGYVALLGGNGNENEVLFLDAGGCTRTVDPSLPIPIRSLHERAYTLCEPVYENSFDESDWTTYFPEGHARPDNVLFAPLVIDGRAVGIIGLANNPSGFTEKDARIASTFGALAAIALRNKTTLDSLEASETRLSAVIESSGDAIVTTDSDFVIVSINSSVTGMFGKSPEECIGRHISILVPGVDTDSLPCTKSDESTSGTIQETIELNGIRSDNEIFPVELTCSEWTIRDKHHVTFFMRDITGRKEYEQTFRDARDELEQRVGERTRELERSNENLRNEIAHRVSAEEKLRRQHSFLNNIVESITYPFYVIDADTYEVILANSATGFTDTPGMTCHSLFYGSDVPCDKMDNPCPLKLAKETGKAVLTEHVIKTQEGAERYLEVHGYPIFDDDGRIVQFIEYMIDISKRKRAEREHTEAVHLLERSTRLASIGVMAAGINHEINQPLTAIKFHVDGLLYWEKNNSGAIPDFVVDSLRDISDGIRRIDEIIKHMRTFRTSSDDEKAPLSLNDTIAKAMKLIDRQLNAHQILCRFAFDDADPHISGHQVHIEQIIVNLSVNAMHALDDSGKTDKHINIGTMTYDGYALITVEDNGTGIDTTMADSLFDPFCSTKRSGEGMGLGLAIVYNFVEDHDGTITIENNASGGTTVSIRFPVIDTDGGT